MSDSRQPFGFPQLAAALLLAVFFFQCFWLISHRPLSEAEWSFIGHTPAHFQEAAPTAGAESQDLPAPIVTALANAPLRTLPRDINLELWQWAFRLPFVGVGLLLGASLWYIARRQFGSVAGYITLGLYCFSPTILSQASSVGPDALTAWGGFGSIYAALAAAHTLYAPRQGALWNRTRIVLLGIALGIAVAAQFATVILIPLALAYMIYLVPERRGAALAIIALGCLIASLFVLATYGFHFRALAVAVFNVRPLQASGELFTSTAPWKMLGIFLLHSSPGVLILLLLAIGAWIGWPEIRFFGTAAPLITAGILILAGLLLPHAGGLSFLVMALPFLFLFIAAVFVDLLERRHALIWLFSRGVLWVVLLSHAVYSLAGLAVISRHR